jgi:hypothetical protein
MSTADGDASFAHETPIFLSQKKQHKKDKKTNKKKPCFDLILWAQTFICKYAN